MNDFRMYKVMYFLNPGELLFSKRPVVVKTVLGSCVSVCIFDKKNKFGGMCHYLLPQSSEKEKTTKYGDVAVPYLISKFIKAGSRKEDLEASVYGGAFIIFEKKEVFFIGDRNIEAAIDILNRNKIKIKEQITGGEKGMRIIFDMNENLITQNYLGEVHVDDLYEKTVPGFKKKEAPATS